MKNLFRSLIFLMGLSFFPTPSLSQDFSDQYYNKRREIERSTKSCNETAKEFHYIGVIGTTGIFKVSGDDLYEFTIWSDPYGATLCRTTFIGKINQIIYPKGQNFKVNYPVQYKMENGELCEYSKFSDRIDRHCAPYTRR